MSDSTQAIPIVAPSAAEPPPAAASATENDSLSLKVLATSAKLDSVVAPLDPVPGPPTLLPEPARIMHASAHDMPQAQRAIEAMVVEVVRTVYDPEIPVNIYDLGLIYEIQIDPENRVLVRMTLTAPGCPVAGSLPLQVADRIKTIPQVKDAEVQLVWEPPWDKSRMSEEALLDLGML
jgi:FeS assembly SUF system protein